MAARCSTSSIAPTLFEAKRLRLKGAFVLRGRSRRRAASLQVVRRIRRTRARPLCKTSATSAGLVTPPAIGAWMMALDPQNLAKRRQHLREFELLITSLCAFRRSLFQSASAGLRTCLAPPVGEGRCHPYKMTLTFTAVRQPPSRPVQGACDIAPQKNQLRAASLQYPHVAALEALYAVQLVAKHLELLTFILRNIV